jgi:hypothetical protein
MMMKRLLGALLLLASVFQPLFASYSDLQLVNATIANDQITFQVHNPNTSAESARIQVTVRFADNSTTTLTSSVVTVAGLATSTVTVSAPHTIVTVTDDPQPVLP